MKTNIKTLAGAVGIIFLFLFSSCQHKKTMEHTRLLPIEGAYNLRDLGGYETMDAKLVKWDMLLRSGDLDKLTAEDLAYLNQLPLRTVVDFRDTPEVERAPDLLPASVQQTFHLPIAAGNVMGTTDINELSDTLLEEMMIAMNKFFVTDCQETYKTFFKLLMDEKNTPLLFHCSAGKDRTGYAAALFLSALGVDRETVIADYMLSAEYVREKYADLVDRNPNLLPGMTVKRAYIDAALDLIDQEYGGMEHYLRTQLDVDIERLREIYTY